ncbi:MAG: DUF4396 domain-containing protein [Anaerolineales bacterium]
MSFDFLSFLTSPVFVVPWYGFGIAAAIFVFFDETTANKHVNEALKIGWPILIFFFSVIGLYLYLVSCRPPGIIHQAGEQAREIHHAFVTVKWKKVLGSAIHCVAGDGLGIVTAMAVARLQNFDFWTEFWYEYAVGFAFGWFIFQAWSMHNSGNGVLKSLWMAGRAEFFSMITVMLGMGLVMRFVTPAVVGYSPDPNTAAFWGFASLGLLVGLIFTFPMNWLLVSIGWKHGMA